MKNSNTKTISEFGLIGRSDKKSPDSKFLSETIDEKHYRELEEFAKTDAGKDVLQFARNGRFLQARNYVGTIQTKSGFTLEILPKTANTEEINTSKRIFMQLLHLLHKLPSYKHVNQADLNRLKDLNLFEVFVFMFIKEVELIIKRGIKSDYIEQEGNLFYMKGKLLINEQIRRNAVHQERFYVAYDEYSQNRAENRLIKSTLRLLANLSTDFTNKRLIRQHLEHMQQIQLSTNHDKDFRSCKKGRGMEHYRHALIWAKVFLKKESFSSFSGDTIAFAILYPMEKLFEAFVEWWLVQKYPKHQVQVQNGGEVFVSKADNNKLFSVRPDFLIEREQEIISVADAKWKLIEEEKHFSQADFYQLFAYRHIFLEEHNVTKSTDEPQPLILFYPKTEYLKEAIPFKLVNKDPITVYPLDIREELENHGKITK